MKQKGIVALVGRPNVGKSSLFNRLIKDRKAIIEDLPGVTRDRIYGTSEWLTREFIVVDTGGLTQTKIPFAKEIQQQTQIAVNEAQVIVFVVDYKEGLTEEDRSVAQQLHRAKKPVILVANKYDQLREDSDQIYDLMSLGFGEPLLISTTHGIGIGDLLDKVVKQLPAHEKKIDQSAPRIAIIGKPNVGKSSLINNLLGEERMIVSSIPGTTRDANDTKVRYGNENYIFVDTAGLRRKGKIDPGLEKYSYLRTLKAVTEVDLVLLMVDVSQPISNLDAVIGGLAFAERKPVIIIANKWDLIKDKNAAHQKKIEKEIRDHFKYLQYARFLFMTATTKNRLPQLYRAISELNIARARKISTSILNEILNRAQLLNPAPEHNRGRLRIYYGTQVEASLPTFVIFVNNPDYLHFSYRRFLENQIRSQLGFEGVPITLVFKERR